MGQQLVLPLHNVYKLEDPVKLTSWISEQASPPIRLCRYPDRFFKLNANSLNIETDSIDNWIDYINHSKLF